MTEVLPDIDVESVFEELECCSRQPSPHGGDVAAYFEYHDCYQGWLCKSHYDKWLTEMRPRVREAKELGQLIRCHCCRRCFSPDDFERVYPL